MSESVALKDADLPAHWSAADSESGRAQKLALILTIGKAGGGAFAALGGTISFFGLGSTIGAWAILAGFFVALTSEIVSWIYHPERRWYNGRAAAESIKTLAWRYAVGANPFPTSLSEKEAQKKFLKRIRSIVEEFPDVFLLAKDGTFTTSAMDALRKQSFALRKRTYIDYRTLDQQAWYTRKAAHNLKRSRQWRAGLILTEVIAVALALGKILADWPVDIAGFLGASIAAGAAWVGVKQFSPLAAAYSVASNELSIQAELLATVEESLWADEAADAEEAISREHTTWMASRTGRLKKSI